MISTLHSFWLRLLMRLALLLAFGAFAASAGAQTTITFFHNDILGSPAIATDADGAVVWKENYLPYGHRLQAPPAGANNKLWFAGKPYDQTNWITYMGGRYYIPLIGRFTGIDPQGIVPENPHSFNRYAYANNNPYKYVDPDGRSARLAWKVGVSLLALAGAASHLTPEQRARMEQAGALLQQRTSELLDRASGLVFNEGADKPVDIVVPGDKYPESADHIRDAQNNGQPDVLTLDRGGAKDRRKDAMSGQPVVPGKDRDEYPPALTAEGGRGASVRPVSPSDNRGAGACIGAQCRGLPDGTRIRIIPGS
ncbi:NucA/NucB deoxyribonuclease domain-containing protein [Acidovorax sp. LjRoot38]|uniref:RHS repeat-associated core domain-containing protein n=1 Tax=Acidovorax sp. LjRoot38 TaxID=3342327 RepID=UPI003ECD0F25